MFVLLSRAGPNQIPFSALILTVFLSKLRQHQHHAANFRGIEVQQTDGAIVQSKVNPRQSPRIVSGKRKRKRNTAPTILLLHRRPPPIWSTQLIRIGLPHLKGKAIAIFNFFALKNKRIVTEWREKRPWKCEGDWRVNHGCFAFDVNEQGEHLSQALQKSTS